ncbi:hypothetical protein D1614_03990 [Maribellus luteus]|uniref:Uncharacterized protein n=1 Tax=Maribellus luteus TaxID=2305463 RepID=A0A399T7L2_9BACT|nr:hypothetical protein D1614_03990 [Maribellus luteus]
MKGMGNVPIPFLSLPIRIKLWDSRLTAGQISGFREDSYFFAHIKFGAQRKTLKRLEEPNQCRVPFKNASGQNKILQ